MGRSCRGSAAVLIMILMLVGGLGAGVGYRMHKQGDLSFPQIPSVPTISLPAIPGFFLGTGEFTYIEDAELRKYIAKQAKERAYEVTETVGTGENTVQYTAQTKKRGNSISFQTWYVENGNTGGELRIINEYAYIKDYTDNTWWKHPVSASPLPTRLLPRDFRAEFLDKTGYIYTVVKEEPCADTETCKVYEETSPDTSEKRSLWFSTGSFRLMKEEVNDGLTQTHYVYTYPNVAIEMPEETKDIPPGEQMTSYYVLPVHTVLKGGATDIIQTSVDAFQKQYETQIQKQLEETLRKQLEEQFQKQLQEQFRIQLEQELQKHGRMTGPIYSDTQ